MLAIAIAMLVSLVVATIVVVYVAFPHRDREVPRAPWVGRVLRRVADAAPVIDESREPRGRRLLG